MPGISKRYLALNYCYLLSNNSVIHFPSISSFIYVLPLTACPRAAYGWTCGYSENDINLLVRGYLIQQIPV